MSQFSKDLLQRIIKNNDIEKKMQSMAHAYNQDTVQKSLLDKGASTALENNLKLTKHKEQIANSKKALVKHHLLLP